jgi:hypothetical protein
MMLVNLVLGLITWATFAAAQSNTEVVALFLLARHGDRTSKIAGLGIEGSSVLTTLGKNEVFEAGTYFGNRYLNSSSPFYVQNVSSVYDIPQIYVSAPYVRTLV